MINTHFGRINLLILLGYCLNHYLLHCSTVAKTFKKQLPITLKNTNVIIPFIKVAMVKLYDKDAAKNFNASFGLIIKGVESFSLLCAPRSVKVNDTIPSIVDCSLTMDSLTFFLISGGYMSQWKALLLGKVLIGGKKPWLAIKLPMLFKGL
jgi:hypothetical protein